MPPARGGCSIAAAAPTLFSLRHVLTKRAATIQNRLCLQHCAARGELPPCNPNDSGSALKYCLNVRSVSRVPAPKQMFKSDNHQTTNPSENFTPQISPTACTATLARHQANRSTQRVYRARGSKPSGAVARKAAHLATATPSSHGCKTLVIECLRV